jgi:hypothetical protein
MDLWTATKVVFRRWAIVVPALVLTAVIAVLVTSRLAPTYKATGTVEFLASNNGNVDNPYNSFNTSLQTTATLVGTSVGSAKVRDQFQKAGLDPNYKIVAPYDPTRAVLVPSLDLSVETSNADITMATLKHLSAAVSADLQTRQAESGAPKNTWVQAHVAAMDTSATQQNGSKTKVLILIILLGAAVSISLAFFAESLTSDSRRRRSAAELPAGDPRAGAYGPPPAADAVLLARALDAMRAALDVANETTHRTGDGPAALPPAPSAPSGAPTPAPPPAPTNGNGSGNGKKAAPAEGIDPKRPVVRPRPEPATGATKPGPLPVARPNQGTRSDEGDPPASGGRAS